LISVHVPTPLVEPAKHPFGFRSGHRQPLQRPRAWPVCPGILLWIRGDPEIHPVVILGLSIQCEGGRRFNDRPPVGCGWPQEGLKINSRFQVCGPSPVGVPRKET